MLVTRVSVRLSWAECTGDAGTLPLQRPAPASSSLAWETLSNRDHQRRPGHAVTEAASVDTADADTRQSSRNAGSVDSSDGTSGMQSTCRLCPKSHELLLIVCFGKRGSLTASVCCSPAGTSEAPNFFASTKFFACLDLKESQQLYEASQLVGLRASLLGLTA